MSQMEISSPAFAAGGAIPALYTCDGKDVSPPLTFRGIPPGAKSLALIVDDPDAPVGDWVHWVVWNIPPGLDGMGEGAVPPGALQGPNGWNRNRYGGPCPPSGVHRYFFRLYALDAKFSLSPSTGKGALEKAFAGHVLARAELMGTYRRR